MEIAFLVVYNHVENYFDTDGENTINYLIQNTKSQLNEQ